MKALLTLTLSVLFLFGYSQSKLVKREVDKYNGDITFKSPDWKGYRFLRLNDHLWLVLETFASYKTDPNNNDVYILFATGDVYKRTDIKISRGELSPTNFMYAAYIPIVKGDELYSLLEYSYIESYKLYIFEQKVKQVKNASDYLDAIIAAE